MTDEDLIRIVADLSKTTPNTSAGVDAIFSLARALETEPEFIGAARTVSVGRGGHGFAPTFVAQRMLHVARAGQGAAAAVAWLRKVSKAERVSGGAVKALYGIKCLAPINMSESVVLMPFSDLPPSDTREWLLQAHDAANSHPGLDGFKPPPTAALYRSGVVEPIFVDRALNPNFVSPTATWFDELDEAALLLALVPRAIPREAAHWIHVEDKDLEGVVQFGISRMGFADISVQHMFDPPEATADSAIGLVQAFRKLKQKDKDRIKLAIGRVARSRCQLHPGNRAIDLSIALEVLFMKTDRDEHSYKISLRTSRLVGDSLESRRAIFAEIKQVYNLRSGMVHTGNADNDANVNGVRRTANDIVETVDAICVNVFRKIFAMGAIPDDWRDIELG